jgi:hypothetical protein
MKFVGFMYGGTAREGRNDLPFLRERGARLGGLPVRFMRYIYLRHLQLSRSGSLPQMRAGQQASARSDSNAAKPDTSNRLA